jgi:hypothetical protein
MLLKEGYYIYVLLYSARSLLWHILKTIFKITLGPTLNRNFQFRFCVRRVLCWIRLSQLIQITVRKSFDVDLKH